MQIYTHVVFVFLLLNIPNFIWYHNSSGWDQIVPVIVGVVLLPLSVIMAIVQFGLEFKFPNPAMIMKYVTKGLTAVVIFWAIFIMGGDGFK